MSEIFRDRTEGAIARRQDLLRKRRDELVTMPHAIRRVIVARAARSAAALAMIASGVAMLVVALSPSLAGYIARGLPGINPAVISTFVGATWVLGVVAYAISRARSEHRFAVEMSSYVLPGQDLDQDIERLSHEHPDEVARRMAQRRELSSAALPVAAAAFVLPATLVYVAHGIAVEGWPATADYEANLAQVGISLLLAAIAGSVAAIVMTRPAARSPSVTPVAATIAVLTGGAAAFALAARELTATWLLTVVSVIAGAIAAINWRLARERTAIEAKDPTAGSELFTVRGFVAMLRGCAASVRRRVTAPMAIGSIAFAMLLVYAGAPVTAGTKLGAAGMNPQRRSVAEPVKMIPGNSSYAVVPTGDGRLRVSLTIVDGKPVQILEGLAGMSVVPQHWRAHVTVRMESTDVPGPIAVTPFEGDPNTAPLHFGADAGEHRFATQVCNHHEQPLGLSFAPVGWPAGTHTVTFLVEPNLELTSSCP